MIKPIAKHVRIGGRYTIQGEEQVVYLAGSASYIEFKTKSTNVWVTFLSDAVLEEELKAAIAVFIGEEEVPSLRTVLTEGRQRLKVYESSDPEEGSEVTIRIMKYSEQAFGLVGIEAIESDGEILPTENQKEKLIEFVGDSITCGYGNEGILDQDIFRTTQENPWEAYACRTARILDMDFELLSWSGNGMISQYIPPEVDERKTEKPMIPEMYPYADRELEERMGKKELTLWESTREPDLVVINIGTNDSSYTRNIPERNAFFKKTYQDFVRTVREKHPEAEIICMIGIMDQCLHETIRELVEELKNEGDRKVSFLKCPLQAPEDGLGTDYHPTMITHKKAAILLSDFIRKIYG